MSLLHLELLHILEEHFIVEINYVFSLSCFLINYTLRIYFGYILFALEQEGVFIDDCIESDVFQTAYL